MNDAGRKARANAPVKWFAVRLAQDAGLLRYDVNGLLNDGVSTFKRSFAKHEDQARRHRRRAVLPAVPAVGAGGTAGQARAPDLAAPLIAGRGLSPTATRPAAPPTGDATGLVPRQAGCSERSSDHPVWK